MLKIGIASSVMIKTINLLKSFLKAGIAAFCLSHLPKRRDDANENFNKSRKNEAAIKLLWWENKKKFALLEYNN